MRMRKKMRSPRCILRGARYTRDTDLRSLRRDEVNHKLARDHAAGSCSPVIGDKREFPHARIV